MNLTSSSHLGIPNRFRCQQMPLLFHKDGCLIGGSDTVCNFHHRPINPSGMHLGNYLCFCTTKLLKNRGRRSPSSIVVAIEVSSVHFPNSVYCTPAGLYYTCNFRGQLIRVITLLALPLSELPNWNLYLLAVFHPTTGSRIL